MTSTNKYNAKARVRAILLAFFVVFSLFAAAQPTHAKGGKDANTSAPVSVPIVATSDNILGIIDRLDTEDPHIIVLEGVATYKMLLDIGETISGNPGAKIILDFSAATVESAIPGGAFYGCANLVGFKFPKEEFFMRGDVFTGCKDIVFTAGSGCSTSEDGRILYNAEKTVLLAYPSAEGDVVIQDGVKSVGGFAFKENTSITSVVIPHGAKEIGWASFRGCTALTRVEIPETVDNIFGEAFQDCTNLTDIVIPDSVAKIQISAFKGCTSLSSVVIPGSVTDIHNYVFNRCVNLKRAEIRDGVKTIGRGVFNECVGLESVVIPASIEKIDEGAFNNCKSLKNVYYSGTAEQWAAIDVGRYNDILAVITVHVNP